LQANQQKKAAKNERQAVEAAEQKSQEQFRNTLRGGASGRGAGDFGRPTGSGSTGGFEGALKQITGR